MATRPFPIGLPSGIRLESLKEQAKDLLKSVRAGEANGLDRARPYFRDSDDLTLQRTQLELCVKIIAERTQADSS
ncbi:MAG: hypothetical protein OXI79_17665 [Gammaproteobacteria bacterium]|nr:hypothetical protein [Gammaproteobacteria bacterium]